jgi:hypothetical protein
MLWSSRRSGEAGDTDIRCFCESSDLDAKRRTVLRGDFFDIGSCCFPTRTYGPMGRLIVAEAIGRCQSYRLAALLRSWAIGPLCRKGAMALRGPPKRSVILAIDRMVTSCQVHWGCRLIYAHNAVHCSILTESRSWVASLWPVNCRSVAWKNPPHYR